MEAVKQKGEVIEPPGWSCQPPRWGLPFYNFVDP